MLRDALEAKRNQPDHQINPLRYTVIVALQIGTTGGCSDPFPRQLPWGCCDFWGGHCTLIINEVHLPITSSFRRVGNVPNSTASTTEGRT
jgi:hypothetical protein